METLLILSIIILGVGFIMLSRNNNNLHKDIKKLTKENDKLKNELNKVVEDNEEIMSIDPGDKAIIPNYGLTYTGRDISFKIDYEVEIIDVSENKVKVSAFNFIPNCKIGRDPQNRQGILDFMQKKWVSKNEIELIVDDATRRDVKLKKLGI